MKVYLLYLKKDKSLYAFTATKEYYKNFLSDRNPKCFSKKILKMTESEFSTFSYSYKNFQIIKDILECKDSLVEMMVTMYESTRLEEEIDRIEIMRDDIVHIFSKYPLKKKYQKSVENLITVDDGNGNLLIDTLSLFVDLNKDTFIT